LESSTLISYAIGTVGTSFPGKESQGEIFERFRFLLQWQNFTSVAFLGGHMGGRKVLQLFSE